jgi:uncharacterized protein YbjT (DUF2867 family)
MIFVTGATGKVGRHVVSGLVQRDVAVRALVRDPAAAGLPAGVDVVSGDLTDPARVSTQIDGADAVFLLWPFFGEGEAGELVEALASQAARIVYLSAEAAARRPDSFWAAVEQEVERSADEWTFLRPTGFAANTLMWADQIRESGIVRWPYGQAKRSLIHESDIADVAVLALTEAGHAGERYVVTGPEAINQVEQVNEIGEAIGQDLRWEELSREDAEAELGESVPDTALDTWAGFVDTPEVVTSTVEDVTGHPARPFGEWARDHAGDFSP